MEPSVAILKTDTNKGETGLKHFWNFLFKAFEELLKHSCNFKFKFNLRKAKMFEIPSNQGKRMADWGAFHLKETIVDLGVPSKNNNSIFKDIIQIMVDPPPSHPIFDKFILSHLKKIIFNHSEGG